MALKKVKLSGTGRNAARYFSRAEVKAAAKVRRRRKDKQEVARG